MVSDRPLPDIVCRVEYYRDQRLFMLVYFDEEQDEDLMHYEVPAPMTNRVEASPNIMIYSSSPTMSRSGTACRWCRLAGFTNRFLALSYFKLAIPAKDFINRGLMTIRWL